MRQAPREMTISIIETASNALERPMEDLPQLSKSVNIDAINELVSDDPAHDVTITFPYAGLRFVVHSEGTVYARPIHEESAQP